MKVTILGARGSIATSGRDVQEFGGATSCVLVETDKEAVFIDAGTGIMNSPDLGDRRISILISHPHMDHLGGLPFFPYLYEPGCKIDIYAANRNGLSTTMQLDRMISPPLWPLRVVDYKSDVVCHDIRHPFSIGDIHIDLLESHHPGGCTLFRVTHEDRSLVYATDYEHEIESLDELVSFSEGTDLLLYDAQYTDEEYEEKKGFGHSTAGMGLRVMKESGAKQIRFVHHDPRHTDEMMRKMESAVGSDTVAYAREGEVIEL